MHDDARELISMLCSGGSLVVIGTEGAMRKIFPGTGPVDCEDEAGTRWVSVVSDKLDSDRVYMMDAAGRIELESILLGDSDAKDKP